MLARMLVALRCSGCGLELEPREGPASAAASFDDCLRRCDPCGLAWSNSSTHPVRIWKEPTHNVPAEVRPGIIEAVAAALNERNRKTKLLKLASESSEDAVTWTVFSLLTSFVLAHSPWRSLAGLTPEDAPLPRSVLIWGTPLFGGGAELRAGLVAISSALGEVATSRTEPDVIIDLGPFGLVFVEVKYKSGNDAQSKKPWDMYTTSDAFLDRDLAKKSGRYELVRNWRIGCELARERPFSLVNLVRTVESGPAAVSTREFAASVKTGPTRRFAQLTFRALLENVPQPWPPWFADYVALRQLQVDA
jgi:hypothetical protein